MENDNNDPSTSYKQMTPRGRKLLLTAVTEDWMRGFILRLQDSFSALRTNSKQTLRKHRRQILPPSSMTTWMKELHPSERQAAKSQKLRNHVLSHPGVFLPPLAPSISLFFFFFFFCILLRLQFPAYTEQKAEWEIQR